MCENFGLNTFIFFYFYLIGPLKGCKLNRVYFHINIINATFSDKEWSMTG